MYLIILNIFLLNYFALITCGSDELIVILLDGFTENTMTNSVELMSLKEKGIFGRIDPMISSDINEISWIIGNGHQIQKKAEKNITPIWKLMKDQRNTQIICIRWNDCHGRKINGMVNFSFKQEISSLIFLLKTKEVHLAMIHSTVLTEANDSLQHGVSNHLQ